MAFGYIYKTTDLQNGKIYIGLRSGDFDPSYFGSGKLIKQRIKNQGLIGLQVEMLQTAESKDELERLEKNYIADAKRLMPRERIYNITAGGQGTFGVNHTGSNNPMFGRNHSEETKRKISIAQKNGTSRYWLGKKFTADARRKMSEAKKLLVGDKSPRFGIPCSEETKKKLSQIFSNRPGRPQTAEERRKRSISIRHWHQQRKENGWHISR
jgi:group I intron endonuclease